MKELRTILRVLSLATLSFLCYGAFTSEGAAIGSPAVTITQPVHGALVQGKVTVSVSYRSASGVNVTDVELYVDKALYKAQKLETPATAGVCSFLWDTNALAAGVHTITAIAVDAKGQPGNVAVSVYVDTRQDGPDTQAPTVEMKRPAAGTALAGVVQLIASARDNASVDFVLFFLDDRMLFGTNHPPYEFAWDTTKVANGEHKIRVYAYDAAQNTGESSPIVVTVNNPGGQTLPGARLSQAAPPATPPAPKPATGVIVQQRAVQPDPRVVAPGPKPPAKFQPTPQTAKAPQLPAAPRSGPAPKSQPVVAPPQAPAQGGQPDIVAIFEPARPGSGAAAPSSTVAPASRSGRATATVPPLVLSGPSLSGAADTSPRWKVGTDASRMAKAAATVPSPSPLRGRAGGRPIVTPGAARTQTGVGAVMEAVRGVFLGSVGMQQRATMPAGAGPLLDSAARLPQVVAIVVTSPAASLAPSANGARVAAPAGAIAKRGVAVSAHPVRKPVLAPQASVVASSRVPATSPARGSSPGKAGAPLVSLPAGQSGNVLIARVESGGRRTVPMAVISVHNTQPVARRAGSRPAAPGSRIVVAPAGRGPITMVFNGRPVKFDRAKPFTQAGIMFTPFRHIVEHEGGAVLWNNLIKQVRASADGRRIEFTIGDAHAVVNSETVKMQAAASIKNGRAIVPISFLRDALDVVVEYDPTTGRVTIAAR